MQKKHKSKGFVIIAAHRQGADLKDKALGLCRSHKVNYMVTQQGGPVGDTGSGIPRAYLFDWTGKCVAEGHPSKLYSKVDELMKKAPNFLTGGKTFKSDKVNGVAKKLNSNKDFGKLVGELSKIGGEEADYLKGRITEHGQSMLDSAKELETDNAFQALSDYKKVEKLYKGHELGKAASARLKELKKDKAFQKELKAAKILTQMESVATGYKSAYKPAHPANRKIVATLGAMLKKLRKKYPESNAYAKAQELIKGMGLG